MKNVLWLVSWYPNRLDKFDGDFIQRHAQAVSLFCRVHVIYVKKDESVKTNSFEKDISCSGNLTEEIIYYNASKTGIGFIDKIKSFHQYKRHYRNAISDYIALYNKPRLIHVHVAMKAGIAAWWAKQRWGIPYIVSEHWTAYLKEADHRIEQQSFYFKRLLAKVMAGSETLTVVSHHLGKSIQGYFPGQQYRVIPNVVDTNIFYPGDKRPGTTVRFVHVSNMNYQKNTGAIIKAVHELAAKASVQLDLYGPVNPGIEMLVRSLGLQQVVTWKGEVPQAELAEAMRQCDALVLYSRFETFGCVLIEANACGIPVIVSDLPVFHEIVEEEVNGTFTSGENVAALAHKLEWLIANRHKFNRQEIAAAAAAKFSYQHVGSMYLDCYDSIT